MCDSVNLSPPRDEESYPYPSLIPIQMEFIIPIDPEHFKITFPFEMNKNKHL